MYACTIGHSLCTTCDVINLKATRYFWKADNRARTDQSTQLSVLDIDRFFLPLRRTIVTLKFLKNKNDRWYQQKINCSHLFFRWLWQKLSRVQRKPIIGQLFLCCNIQTSCLSQNTVMLSDSRWAPVICILLFRPHTLHWNLCCDHTNIGW